MPEPTTIDQFTQDISEINQFIKEKYDPLAQAVGLITEETARLVDSVSELLKTKAEIDRLALLRVYDATTPMVTYRASGGETRYVDEVDVKIINAFYWSMRKDVGTGRLTQEQISALPEWEENIKTVKRALDSTTVGSGDELVPTADLPEMWNDIHLATSVKSMFRSVSMPTNPFNIPLQLGNVNWYRGVANVAATSSDPATNRRTLSAQELVSVVAWAYDLDEDAVIAMLPEIRATLVRNAAEVMDDMILNGDTSDAGININADGAASGALSGAAGLDHFLSFDGLIKIPVVSNTSQHVTTSSAVTNDMYNEVRSKLDKYGVRPSEMAIVMDLNTYIRAQSLSEFRTLDKFGPQATIMTGQLGAVEGIPVIVSEQMLLADTDGKVSSGGNGTDTGRFIIVNRTQYWVGTRRELLIEVDRSIEKRQTIMVVSFRMAFEGRNDNTSDNAVAQRSNITGVN